MNFKFLQDQSSWMNQSLWMDYMIWNDGLFSLYCLWIQSNYSLRGWGDADGAKMLPLHPRWLTHHIHLQLSVCQCGHKLSLYELKKSEAISLTVFINLLMWITVQIFMRMKHALLLSISFVWLVNNNSNPTPPCMSLSVQINNQCSHDQLFM